MVIEMPVSKMLNIGCGTTYHPSWTNLDLSSADPSVISADITNGLPFSSDSISVCYSSHLLEHLDKAGAKYFLSECLRILEKGGILRLAVPDLEIIAREYLRLLNDAPLGDKSTEIDYDWIMLEMYDQSTRSTSGGEMAQFLNNLKESNRNFVRSRIGAEGEKFWGVRQVSSQKTFSNIFNKLANKHYWKRMLSVARERLAGWLVYLIAGKTAFRNFRIGTFRGSGEVHQWMYDRYSIKRLLEHTGFVNVEICTAYKSRIPGFEKYSLDVYNGNIRKPDSLYVEASKS
jgi:predicted SAM-dependent methyltransferase